MFGIWAYTDNYKIRAITGQKCHTSIFLLGARWLFFRGFGNKKKKHMKKQNKNQDRPQESTVKRLEMQQTMVINISVHTADT